MDEQIVEQLKLIADLLRRRVEIAESQQAAQEELREEAADRFRDFKLEMPKLELPEWDHGAAMKRIEDRGEEERQERMEFQRALISEFKRHNELLEQLLSRKT